MPFRNRVAAFAFGAAILVATIALLAGGWYLGLALAARVDRTAAMVINALLALTPAAIALAMRTPKTPIMPIVVVAILLVVAIATLNLHAAVWVGPHLPRGSTQRAFTALSALIWPALAIGALLAVVRRRTQKPLGSAATIAALVPWVAVQLALVWILVRLLSGVLPVWLLILVVVIAAVVLQFVVESEVAVLLSRRGATAVPPPAASVKSEMDAMTNAAVEGPLVVDRGDELTAEIRWRLFGRPVLILSTAMAGLEALALRAVIAHEYAHVALGHLRARLWWSIASALLVVAAMMQAARAITAGSSRPIAMFLIASVALFTQRFCLYALMRRQERAADTFAASVAGADAMRAALRSTAPRLAIPPAFSMWMTHDSPGSRRRALDDRRS